MLRNRAKRKYGTVEQEIQFSEFYRTAIISYPLNSIPPTGSSPQIQQTSFLTPHRATPHLLLEYGKAGFGIRSKGGCTPPLSGCAQPPLPVKNSLGTARMKKGAKKNFSSFRLTQFGGL